jgi:hypothetical protein
MKKILILATSMLAAAACAAPPTNREATTGSSTNRAAESKASAPLTEADAIAKERQVWDAIKSKDYEAFGNMLTDDFISVASDGVYDKAGTINGVKTFEPSEVTFSDWKFLPIDKDAGVIIYSATVKGKVNGKDMPPSSMHAGSAWVNRNGKWLAIYHQDAEVAKVPPPPPSANKSAKAAASPALTPAGPPSTSSDPVANEKLVWETLKSKNFDAFAALLAPEAIEVEASGIFDKAGSVKGVQPFDFSKAEVSDFKSVKLDDDAALVTYLLTMPGAKPEKERHTTIWASRDGKWLALFHHGTPAAPPMAKASPTPLAKVPTSTPAKPAATKSPAN